MGIILLYTRASYFPFPEKNINKTDCPVQGIQTIFHKVTVNIKLSTTFQLLSAIYGCVPLEMVDSAAFLLCTNCGGTPVLTTFEHHKINESAVYCT
jgi:hypothetical protein